MKKNIIWITLDSIRADRTPFGEHSRRTMPVLDSFASSSESFGTTCTSHAIWSLPSVASMLTGQWPSRHGAGLHNEVVPAQITTVPERLSDSSYHTVGISTNSYFSGQTGLDRGFDEFHHLGVKDLFKAGGITGALSFVRNLRRYSGGLTAERRKHTPDFLLNRFVEQRLESLAESEQPFCLFAHYLGAHHPYYPAPAFRDAFEPSGSITPSAAAELAFQTTSDVYSTIANGDTITDEEWAAIRTAYDCLLKQIDSLIGRLIDRIDELGLTDNTIIVFTSDHGDLIGEHDLVSHKLLLHDSLIQVPLVVHGSDKLRSAPNGQLQHIDVVQTILDEVGAPTEGMSGLTLPDESREFAIAQRGKETAVRTLKQVKEQNPHFDHPAVHQGLLTALRSPKWKLVKGPDSSVLYDLPDEYQDRSAENADLVQQFTEQIDDQSRTFGEPLYSNEHADFSDDVQQRLSDLGYVVR